MAARMKLPPFPTGRWGYPGRGDLAGIAAVILVAILAWIMIHAVTVSLYRQFEPLGEFPDVPVAVPGPGLDGQAARGTVSHLGPTGYFWSERAFHYRTALMFAVDGYQDPAVLGNDTWQQHPDGVNAWREYTLLMEPFYGFLYRLAGDQSRPFVEFLLRLVPFVHVLAFFGIYGMVRALGGRPLAAALAVVVAATCTLGFLRLSGSLLLKEDFALLLLTSFLALHLWAWRTGGRGRTLAAALMLVPLLASWHLAQFLVLVVMTGAAVSWASRRADDKEDQGPWPGMPLAYLVAALVAAITPSLAERAFWFSLPVAVLVAWSAVTLLERSRQSGALPRPARLAAVVGLMAFFGAGFLFLRADGGDYGHVFGLLVAKITHGFVKPADPGMLSFDVRVFWAAPFHTPSWNEIWAKLGWHTLLMGPAVLYALVRGLSPGEGALRRSFLLTVPVFAAGWLLVERLGVVFLPVGSVAAAVMVESLAVRLESRGWTRPRMVTVFAVGLGLTAALNMPTNLGDMLKITRQVSRGRDVMMGVSDRGRHEAWRDLFTWVRKATPRNAAFLGEIGVSPQLLLYTGRPVVLNSQFENTPVRRRYEEYVGLLFDTDENRLWEFARRHGARYVFINRNIATHDRVGSVAYLAGLRPGELAEGMTVVRMHFSPENLSRFHPVYDNAEYRVFAVTEPGGGRIPAWEPSLAGVWERANFTFAAGRLTDPSADRVALAAYEAALSGLQDRQAAILTAVEDKWRRSRPGAGGRPDLMTLHRNLTRVRWQAPDDPGRPRLENAVRARLSEVDPTTGRSVSSALGVLAHGPDGWLTLLADHAGEPGQYAACGQLLALAGRYGEAADLFEHAADLYPAPVPGRAVPEMQIRLWQEAVWWMMGDGRTVEGSRLAMGVLSFVPSSHPARQVIASAAALADHE